MTHLTLWLGLVTADILYAGIMTLAQRPDRCPPILDHAWCYGIALGLAWWWGRP